MFPHRIVRYAVSSQTKVLMDDQQRSHPTEILYEDQVTVSDGQTRPYPVLLQLTSESLIIRSLNTTPSLPLNLKAAQAWTRRVTIRRDPVTRSLGFWIKGGADAGCPILISRVLGSSAQFLNIGDAILTINNEDIANFTHDQVIRKLRDTPGDQIDLTVKYMKEMATYLHLTTHKCRSAPIASHTSLTLPRRYLTKDKQEFKRMSAEYPFEYRDDTKHQRWSLVLSDQQKHSINYDFDHGHSQEYSLLYAYVTQYLNGTDKLRTNSFQVHTLHGPPAGIFLTSTSLQQTMWISRLNMVIRNLTTRMLAELNQAVLSNEQVFYITWVHERDIAPRQSLLSQWKAICLAFKGADLYIFDNHQSPPLRAYDFISCTRIYPLVEVFVETISPKDCLDDRRYCFTLTLPNDTKVECRYLNFERKTEYDDFILNYQRSLYIAVHTIQTRTFGCLFQGQICRLNIDINTGLELYDNASDVLLWTFTFEQLQSSSDNSRDQMYFQFHRHPTLDDQESTLHVNVQCQYLKKLIHVINAFLTVKFLSHRDEIIA